MPSRPPLRRTIEDIEMQPHTSFTNPHSTRGPTIGLADQEKGPTEGFDTIVPGSNTKIEEAQYVKPIQTAAGESSLDPYVNDPFGNEEGKKVKYKTLTWWYV